MSLKTYVRACFGITAGAASVVFGVMTLYALAAGLREMPSLQVDHVAAGAGDARLLWRGALALLATVSMLVWLQLRRTGKRGRWIVLAAVPLLVFFLTPSLLERHAPGYNRWAFQTIVQAYEQGETITEDDVIQRLGTPLNQERSGTTETWSYTYMPSTGFGWPKRMLQFDQNGMLIDYEYFNEP